LSGEPLGRPYLLALYRARECGQGPVRLLVTTPPFPGLGEGQLRVVGQRATPDGPEWIVAYTGYRRRPRGVPPPA
jgi:hypothetical protein